MTKHTKPTYQMTPEMIALAAFVLSIFEIITVVISLLPGAWLILKALDSSTTLLLAINLALAYYSYQFATLIVCALAIRLTPNPHSGELSTKRDLFLNFVKIGISLYLVRSSAYKLAFTTPFPGAFYFWLAGGKCEGMLGVNLLISEPNLISIGKGTTIGMNSSIVCHIQYLENKTGKRVSFVKPVVIGKNVLIGDGTSIHPGVKISDNAVVGEKSLVKPNTVIPSNEFWAGVPAEFKRLISTDQDQSKTK